MSQYFIFGLQRSGTNFVEQCLRLNYNNVTRVNRQNKCWKHSINYPQGFAGQKSSIIIFKNPYTWLESIAFRNTVDWAKRQTTYDPYEECDPELRIGPRNYNAISLVKTYKHFHATWVTEYGFNPEPIYVKYEDLLIPNRRDQIFMGIESRLDLKRKKPHLVYPDKGKVSQSSDYDDIRELYYIKQRPERLTPKQVSMVGDVLGDMISELGYERLA